MEHRDPDLSSNEVGPSSDALRELVGALRRAVLILHAFAEPYPVEGLREERQDGEGQLRAYLTPEGCRAAGDALELLRPVHATLRRLVGGGPYPLQEVQELVQRAHEAIEMIVGGVEAAAAGGSSVPGGEALQTASGVAERLYREGLEELRAIDAALAA